LRKALRLGMRHIYDGDCTSAITKQILHKGGAVFRFCCGVSRYVFFRKDFRSILVLLALTSWRSTLYIQRMFSCPQGILEVSFITRWHRLLRRSLARPRQSSVPWGESRWRSLGRCLRIKNIFIVRRSN
jgi:hypothetical protein